jgi:hypothetical protein
MRLSRWLITVPLALCPLDFTQAEDKTEIATSALELGGSLGKMVWQGLADRKAIGASADDYTKLAYRVRSEIDIGRSSSAVVSAQFNFLAINLGYAAVVSPEPLSKGIAGVAAWGAKKAGDALSAQILDKTEERAREVLAEGLKESGLSASEIHNMSAAQLRSHVADFQIGGTKIRDILKDDKTLEILQEASTDLALDLGVEAVAQGKAIGTDVNEAKQQMLQMKDELTKYQNATNARLNRIQTSLTKLQNDADVAKSDLEELKSSVANNTTMIKGLVAVSYSGWSTGQKLQAIEGGLFPELNGVARDSLIKSLRSQMSVERTVSSLETAARDFGNLASIAGDLHLPKELVTGLNFAQNTATSIGKFLTGDILGGIAGLTSLIGLGGPDLATERHKEIMNYLVHIDKQLDTVIELQVKTLNALAELANAQSNFRIEVLGQLDQIQYTVLENNRILQRMGLADWEPCRALIHGKYLNTTYTITDAEILRGMISSQGSDISNCYRKLDSFLTQSVKPGRWGGEVIDAGSYPATEIASNTEQLKKMENFQRLKIRALGYSVTFLKLALGEKATHEEIGSQAAALARIALPATNTYGSANLDEIFAKDENYQQFKSFRCPGDRTILAPALADLLCVGVGYHHSQAPSARRLGDLLDAPLIGPQANTLMDIGLVVATLSDFGQKIDNQATFKFADSAEHLKIPVEGLSGTLRKALEQRKGRDLLLKLQWLAEVQLLQQAVAYGDFTAIQAERALYDPKHHALFVSKKELEKNQTRQAAMWALQTNPVLARNVVMLALRHAFKDSLGSGKETEKAGYLETYYQLALDNFRSDPCSDSWEPKVKLRTLLPNWDIEYRATTTEQMQPQYKDCRPEVLEDLKSQISGLGSGPAVDLDGFYVLLPDAPIMAGGIFEQPDSLRLALANRDHLSQALIDREIADVIKKTIADDQTYGRFALDLMNNAWEWDVAIPCAGSDCKGSSPR